MCEVPSNVICADEFLDVFDGFSIGSNDLTQLTLGVDRDSATVAHVYDERNPAVLSLIKQVRAHRLVCSPRELSLTPSDMHADHRRLQTTRQVRWNLWAGPVGSPWVRRAAGGVGHRVHFAQP